jgi:hypothetical protein
MARGRQRSMQGGSLPAGARAVGTRWEASWRGFVGSLMCERSNGRRGYFLFYHSRISALRQNPLAPAKLTQMAYAI